MAYIIKDGVLYHHGIEGQKWGVRNGPPYPLNEGQASPSEKKEGFEPGKYAKNDEEYIKLRTEELKLSSRACKMLGLPMEDNVKVEKVAKILGISLATTAGVLAAGYAIKFYKDGRLTQPGFNEDGLLHSRNIKTIIGMGMEGKTAVHNGYSSLSASDFFNASSIDISPDELIRNVRLNQISSDGTRRLSCWSASHAYFLSRTTGKDYVSKSFTNLVNFNDFGKMYKNPPKIHNLYGQPVSDFVGRFGENGTRCGKHETSKLISSLFRYNESSIGFIDAAYHSTTCTHQWNFEFEIENGIKTLFMSDGYSGDRYAVAIEKGGSIFNFQYGFDKLVKEMSHYNAESVRYYAPKLEDLNIDVISKIVLGNMNDDVKHGGFKMDYYLTEDGYLMHYGIEGQKWGKRNGPPYPLDESQASASEKRAGFSSKYTGEQYRRDRKVYGRSAAKRVQRRVDGQDWGVQEARSAEADRINRTRNVARKASVIGGYAGGVAGIAGGIKLSKYIYKKYGNADIFRNDQFSMAVSAAIAGGAAYVGRTIGQDGLRSMVMISRGYSPSKYR